MGYFIGEIEETFGGYETTSRFVFSAPDEIDPESVMDRLTRTFRGDEEDAVGADGDYIVEGIRIRARGCAPIPHAHFDVLKFYLSDLSLDSES